MDRAQGFEGLAEEAFAGGSGEEREVEDVEGSEVGVEGVVFFAEFAEAEAGIEDDAVVVDAGGDCGGGAFVESGEDVGQEVLLEEWVEGLPGLRGAAGVHEDDSAGEFGAGVGHGGIPLEAADVVDDLCPGGDGVAGGGGVVGVDGEDGVGCGFEEVDDDGEDASLLFVGGEWGGVGAGGFTADVDDVCAVIEEGEGVGDGALGFVGRGVEVSSVGEGVGRDVEDAHDAGVLAEGEGVGAEVPVEARAGGEGHGWILDAGDGDMGPGMGEGRRRRC